VGDTTLLITSGLILNLLYIEYVTWTVWSTISHFVWIGNL